MSGTLLAVEYPDAKQWRELVQKFSHEAIAHKLLLSNIPFVFKNEPAKYAVFRRIVADEFRVQPTDVFIVGSAMAGRSLKGKDIDQIYSPESDIDALIVSEPLFTSLLMQSLEWVRDVTRSTKQKTAAYELPNLDEKEIGSLYRLADNACKGIWRPDSLPGKAQAREDFFSRFSKISFHTLGLQLSDDTVAKVNGRVARSFECAVTDLANSIYRLKKEFESIDTSRSASGVREGYDAVAPVNV
jgi:hypothetical protein